MKVLIVTTQRHFNFGTLLQCHALQRFVESVGCDVEVLDYRCQEYSRSRLRKLRIFIGDLRRNPLKHFKILRNTARRHKRESLFERFLRQRINLTESQYATFESIESNLPVYDIYIAGSDQIWNPRLGGFKPVYFLKFAPEDSLKMSYAASFGIDSFNAEESAAIKAMTKDLNSISCREQSGVDFLHGAGIDSTLVADPTLLLSADYWHGLCDNNLSKSLDEEYVLSYFLSKSDCKDNMIRHSFGNSDIKCLDLCVDADASSESVLDAGPEQFLSLIANCKLLITDSFHGIVFAIIFHKNFYIVPRKDKDPNSQNTRVINLLEKLGLMNRWIPSMMLPEVKRDIDFAKVEPLRQAYIQTSSDWLTANLKKAVR